IRAETEVRAAGVAVVDVWKQCHRERAPGLQGDRPIRLPAREQALSPTGGRAFANRQIVRVAQREAMANVEVRTPAFGAQIQTVLREIRIARAGENTGSIVDGF